MKYGVVDQPVAFSTSNDIVANLSQNYLNYIKSFTFLTMEVCENTLLGYVVRLKVVEMD